MDRIRWLHLSDFHFSASMIDDPYDAEKVIRPLLELIEQRRRTAGPVDLLFITGDIGYHGKERDYEATRQYFDRLAAAAGVPRDSMWVVPGNHDVERDPGRALRRTIDDDQEASSWFFADPRNRANHLSKFANYQRFIESYFPGRELAPGDVVHRPVVQTLHGVKLGILPLNSAWFAQGDDDRGKLWIGSRLVRERAESLRSAGAESIVGLFHHPLTELHENDTAGAWIRNQCDFFLRGHLHSANLEAVVSDEGAVIEIAAGASYQGSAWPCRAFYGTFDASQRSITLDPIRYVDSAATTTWTLDVEAFPGRAASGYSATYQLPQPVQVVSDRPTDTFPHADWTAVNRFDWLPSIVDWFGSTYAKNPHATMADLIAHVSVILENSKAQHNLDARVANLAKVLVSLLPASDAANAAQLSHHSTVLQLLAFGINRDLSHLFMLPRIDLAAILDVPDYSRLLLATRCLGAGEYRRASAVSSEIGPGCCVALYVMAQCERKMELNHEAQSKFDALGRLVRTIDDSRQAYPCSASRSVSCLCNRDLLRASLERASGVVARRLGNQKIAEQHFSRATTAALQAVKTLSVNHPDGARDALLVSDYDRSPYEVLADVHYSHGYYWYDLGNLEKASKLFKLSISALAKSESPDSWDSPYTRLAIVYFTQGDLDHATTNALRARNICKSTPDSSNREGPLSLALNTLTLRAVEAKTGRMLIAADNDVLLELQAALALTPPLALGPLACHAKDAAILLDKSEAPEFANLARSFIDRLEAAQHEIADPRISGRVI